jgi:two-component system response regulator RegX3
MAGRSLSRQRRIYERGRLRIDYDAYEVFLDDQRVHLFLREFELLCFLVQWPNRVFDRGEILDSVWGSDSGVDPRTIDVHIRRLRAAIERDPARPELIVTIRRVGYKFDDRVLAPVAHAMNPAGSVTSS